MYTTVKVKVKVGDTWYSASLWASPITKALRYGTRCQEIAQFYLPPTRLSTNEMNHIPAFAFPTEAGSRLIV